MKIKNLSPHQHLVGRTFDIDGCLVICLAAHEDRVLILTHDNDGQPANYVVCYNPILDGAGKLHWTSGSYFIIPEYRTYHPASTALQEAVYWLSLDRKGGEITGEGN